MYTKTKLRQMQNIEAFEDIYVKLDEKYKNELQDRTKATNKNTVLIIALFVLALIAMTMALIQYKQDVTPNIWIAVLIGALILAFILAIADSKNGKSICEDYKNVIIGQLVKEIESNLRYSINLEQPEKTLIAYKDFGYHVYSDRAVHMDNEISGKLRSGINVKINDMAASKPGTNNRSTLDFQGLFIQIESPKNINADVKVLNHNSTMYKKEVNRLKVEDKEFEKNFKVYTNNDYVATKLLTNSTIEKLKNLFETYGMSFDFVIKDNKVGIRITTGAMFETFALLQRHSKEDLFVNYSILNYAILLTNEIYNIIDKTKI